jgi:hypothetical protein
MRSMSFDAALRVQLQRLGQQRLDAAQGFLGDVVQRRSSAVWTLPSMA